MDECGIKLESASIYSLFLLRITSIMVGCLCFLLKTIIYDRMCIIFSISSEIRKIEHFFKELLLFLTR